jgi:hypothetical protein
VACLSTCCTLVSCTVDFSIQKIEVIISTDTSVHIRTTRRYIPGGGIHNYHCENIKSNFHFSLEKTRYKVHIRLTELVQCYFEVGNFLI